MPLQQTSGAASYDAFGGGIPVAPKYIEDYFSTWLTTGTGSGSQTITNGIDLSGKGGMVWWKTRNAVYNHYLFDTNRGATNWLVSNQTSAQETVSNSLTSFNSDGFTIGDQSRFNGNTFTDVAWSFAKAPKFFDVVTYTGNGVAGRNIPHALNSVPGFVIVKRTDTTGEWRVLHRNDGTNWLTGRLISSALDTSPSPVTFGNDVVFIAPTSTQFTVGSFADVNESGGTYVAYLFAHDAGGFGLTGTDNVISCGSMTTSTPLVNVNLGYEPQWVMWKRTDAVGNWGIADNMRGMPVSGDDQVLIPNLSNAESLATRVAPNATGFTFDGGVADGSTFIYIAIRRGPMKVPTSGTSVFAIDTRNATTPSFVSNFPVDMSTYRAKSGSDWYLQSRLTPNYLFTNSTAAEAVGTVFSATQFAYNTGWGSSGASIPDLFSYMFKRAPSFFDEVCYTGTGSATTVTHNLGVAPELMIVKNRSSVADWTVYAASQGNTGLNRLNRSDTGTVTNTSVWNSTSPTNTVFSVGGYNSTSAVNYVAYLFATCAGVSKVGSYTGTGTTLQVDCGFTGGARFVLIKRTSGTGDWYVWDSARGIVSGNDPYLLLNSTAVEVTSTDYIDTYSAGFEISSTAPAAINASGGTFIFLAIA